MCGPLFLLGLLIPILELTLLVHIGGRIGGLEVITLVFFTAILGIQFVRGQSLAVLQRLHGEGLAHEAHLLDGPLLVLAALMLLFPGFITDALGALLLIPPLRRFVARRIIERFRPSQVIKDSEDDRVIVIRPSKSRRDC